MSLRDDLDAARERVVAVERDVARARARQKEDLRRMVELRHLLATMKPRARPEYHDPFARDMLGFLVVLILIGGILLLGVWQRHG